MSIIITDADKQTVAELKAQMYTHMRFAKDVRADNSFTKIADAKDFLNKAKGMYEVLNGLDLVTDAEMTGEDITRIEEKLSSIYEEKRRNEYPKWRS